MSNKLYTSIPAPKVPRNVFNLSRYCSLTMPYQRVCPTAVQEIIPGDKFFWSAEVFARLQPMIAPVMTDQKISLHAFFVPLRTVNSHFAEFMFNNKAGNYTDVLPYAQLGKLYGCIFRLNNAGIKTVAADVIRLFDYIGLPFSYRSATDLNTFINNWLSDNQPLSASTIRVNLCPFFAYTKVWSEYFRDENLVEDPFEVWKSYNYGDVFSLVGDQSQFIDYTVNAQRTARFAECFLQLRPRAWQHDRFTSSLPFAQRGPDVLLPVTGTFDVTQDGPGLDGNVEWDGTTGNLKVDLVGSGTYEDLDFFGDITGISTTINDFRRAERLQRWYENSSRGGTRPNEATLAHFGVRTPDATLDRAEFLGGNMQPIVVSEVAQTSETTQSSPQGSLAGKGSSYKSGTVFKRFFSEHGFVFVFASALIRPAYWQGVPRVFSRMQRDEYYWPEFALLGEEPVFDKELFVDANTTEDGVFGYVPRYADYKSALPEVHGDFRTSLDFWSNPRKFANQPRLNAEFVFGNPSKKMFAVQSDYSDSLLVTIRHGVKASRLMPFYGVPTI